MKPKDVEMIYFVAIIQSLRDYIDEFNIQADPVFRQKTKVSLNTMISALEGQINNYIKPFEQKRDLSKLEYNGVKFDDIEFTTTDMFTLIDYSEALLMHFRGMIKLSNMHEKESNKADFFVKEYVNLLDKYGLRKGESTCEEKYVLKSKDGYLFGNSIVKTFQEATKYLDRKVANKEKELLSVFGELKIEQVYV